MVWLLNVLQIQDQLTLPHLEWHWLIKQQWVPTYRQLIMISCFPHRIRLKVESLLRLMVILPNHVHLSPRNVIKNTVILTWVDPNHKTWFLPRVRVKISKILIALRPQDSKILFKLWRPQTTVPGKVLMCTLIFLRSASEEPSSSNAQKIFMLWLNPSKRSQKVLSSTKSSKICTVPKATWNSKMSIGSKRNSRLIHMIKTWWRRNQRRRSIWNCRKNRKLRWKRVCPLGKKWWWSFLLVLKVLW